LICGIGCVVVAGDGKDGFTLVKIEADGAVIVSFHIRQVDVQGSIQIERIRKLVGLDFTANGHQRIQIALLSLRAYAERFLRSLQEESRSASEHCKAGHEKDRECPWIK
jgi:hypothetical protein